MRILSNEVSQKAGEKVELAGWVDARRDHGKLIFIDLRDRMGIVQVVFNAKNENVYKLAESLRPEWVVRIRGKVGERPEGMRNPDLHTGNVEVAGEKLEILAEAETPPFEISGDGYEINEEIRMKYRYVDLRRTRMLRNIRLRSEANNFIRNYLIEEGFVEVETPTLTKSTPEGARDYIVPSRQHRGKFYALPQSPQQYKQLLMIAGIERYFQIARCYRDEDTRGNRQQEFTQLDIEMSFVSQEDIMNVVEGLFSQMVKKLCPYKKIAESPWPKLSFKEAVGKYKTDSPDLRQNKDDPNELAFVWIIDFPLFTKQSEEDFFHGSGGAKFAPSHHMFTAPHPDDVELLDKDPMRVRGLQHDLVLNGVEIGGGSIRIHQPEIQEKVFELIGFTKVQKDQFTHMLEAFKYGVPPHGGIAPGLDRLIAALQNEPNIREVIAFPKTGDGRDLMMGAPSVVDEKQLDELGLSLKKK